MMTPNEIEQLSKRIWSIAELLHGRFVNDNYHDTIFALTLMRRMDSANQFAQMARYPDKVAQNLRDFIETCITDANLREVITVLADYAFQRIDQMHRLYPLILEFAAIDLHPARVDSVSMGAVFDHLIMYHLNSLRGPHELATPPDVAQLIVQLLLEPDRKTLSTMAATTAPISIYDPACGFGQMLLQAQAWLTACNEHNQARVFGADKHQGAWAITSAMLYMHGASSEEVAHHILCTDLFRQRPFSPPQVFDYLMTVPPFGMKMADEQLAWQAESAFFQQSGVGLRNTDCGLLFLLYLVEKFTPYTPGDAIHRGSRAAIVLNAVPLFSGAPGSAESEIRRWIIEQDLLEAVVALPTNTFNSTPIGTFVCLLSNRKTATRKGKIQLIDAREPANQTQRKLLGRKREVSLEMQHSINSTYASFANSTHSRIVNTLDFGYRRIRLQHPLRLRFQITRQTKAQFLDACPELLDAILAIEALFGKDPHDDWNEVWRGIARLVKIHGGWRAGKVGAGQRKLLRQVFTTVNPRAKPVLAHSIGIDANKLPALFGEQNSSLASLEELKTACGLIDIKGKWHSFEADPALTENVNIPLNRPVLAYFLQEIRPFAPDAWLDANFYDERDARIGKLGYAINFQQYFEHQQERKSLDEIDKALAEAKHRLLNLLQGELP